jgi:hypothetical protein
VSACPFGKGGLEAKVNIAKRIRLVVGSGMHDYTAQKISGTFGLNCVLKCIWRAELRRNFDNAGGGLCLDRKFKVNVKEVWVAGYKIAYGNCFLCRAERRCYDWLEAVPSRRIFILDVYCIMDAGRSGIRVSQEAVSLSAHVLFNETLVLCCYHN